MLDSLLKYDYFRYFMEISRVPRGSGNNQAIHDYLVDFAKKHHLWYYTDDALNVVIRREAAKGYENLPGIILQGHMDMVCEKETDWEHDFTREGLELALEGDYLYAKGTTLGGDDGIALAYALAILADDTKAYPTIELLATTDEETGMYGAKAFDTLVLQGRYMINLDTEEEGSLLAGCAGGLRGLITLPMEKEVTQGIQYRVTIDGLQGGHSGCEIDKNRTNATLLLGRLLFQLPEEMYSLVEMTGGTKDNAIPRQAEAIVMVAKEKEKDFCALVKKQMDGYKEELECFEPDITWEVKREGEKQAFSVTKSCRKKVLFLLNTAPNGVLQMSGEIAGLVESSLNMGIFSLQEDMKAYYSIRSSRFGYKEYASEKLRTFAQILGGEYEEGEAYPAWLYHKESPLRDKMVEVYEKVYHEKPTVEVIHAGLECGILYEKCPELDIVAIGPDILDIHTPKERMSVSSAKRVYGYLCQVLEALSTKEEK